MTTTTSQNEQQPHQLCNLEALRMACLQMKADAEAKNEVDHRLNKSASLYADSVF